MTLQDVLREIPAARYTKRVPSVIKLAEEGIPVLWDELDDDTSATIYSNGFVLFQSGDHATVFPLHDCKSYEYCSAEEKSFIPYEEFADQPWQIRVFMEGKDRLVHNQKNRTEGRTVSIDAYETEVVWMELSDQGAGDPLRIMVERETKREEIEELYRNLSKLTPHQREILILCVVKGKKREEVAAELGLTHQAVTDCLTKALRRLRRLYGVDENIGGKNNFSRRDK